MDITTTLSPILVVDNDKGLVSTLVESFEDASIVADAAFTGGDAVVALTEKPPGYYKAVILDIDMETPTAGLDILDDIRKHDVHLPIVYLSTYADEDRLDKAIKSGAVQMLPKPVEFPTLYYCLISVVRFAQQLRINDDLKRAAHEREIAAKNKRLVMTKLFNHNMKNLAMAGQAYLQANAVEQARLCFGAIQDQTRRIMAMSEDPGEGDVARLEEAFEKSREELAANPQITKEALGRVAFSTVGAISPLNIKPDTLKALLGELIYNAIVHNLPRSVQVTVSARMTSDGMVQVRVADDGKGVPKEREDTLFRVDENRTEHGFGLPYCYEVLRIHGGSIRYERAPSGQGGAFAFDLPVHRSSAGRQADA